MPPEIGYCNVYSSRYRIYVLKSMQRRFYSIKFEKTNLNNITYNFVQKNAMKLHFDKSFCPVFSKTGGVLGQRPKVLHKFIFVDLENLIKPYAYKSFVKSYNFFSISLKMPFLYSTSPTSMYPKFLYRLTATLFFGKTSIRTEEKPCFKISSCKRDNIRFPIPID